MDKTIYINESTQMSDSTIYGGQVGYPSAPYVIDKVYPNRTTMDSKCADDGIFIGRYVLVRYCNENYDQETKKNIHQTQIIPTEGTQERMYYDNYEADIELISQNLKVASEYFSYDQTVWRKEIGENGPYYAAVGNLGVTYAPNNIVFRDQLPYAGYVAELFGTEAEGDTPAIWGTAEIFNIYPGEAEVDGESFSNTDFTNNAHGIGAHAEGFLTKALATGAHTEGIKTSVENDGGHAEGLETTAGGVAAHAEGEGTIASGLASHAEGYNTKTQGDYSHTSGEGTIADQPWQTVIGKYNETGRLHKISEDEMVSPLFIIGKGESDEARENAFEVYQNGTIKGWTNKGREGTIKPNVIATSFSQIGIDLEERMKAATPGDDDRPRCVLSIQDIYEQMETGQHLIVAPQTEYKGKWVKYFDDNEYKFPTFPVIDSDTKQQTDGLYGCLLEVVKLDSQRAVFHFYRLRQSGEKFSYKTWEGMVTEVGAKNAAVYGKFWSGWHAIHDLQLSIRDQNNPMGGVIYSMK